eukprot:m.14193 g.14193  ORF g.14193 m.14193 type:complete len:386 (+) comp5034_c0_seq1:149-1306(+)
MATNPSSGGSRRRHRYTQDPDLKVNAAFANKLPDVPFQPKFLQFHLDASRFIPYENNLENVEKQCLHDFHPKLDLSIPIDAFAESHHQFGSDNVPLDPRDEALLEDGKELTTAEQRRKNRTEENLPWLRKTYYLTGGESRVYGTHNTGGEHKVLGHKAQHVIQEQETREDRLAKIEQSFVAAASDPANLRHPTKPGLKVVSCVSLFPDFEMQRYDYAQVVFDSDPSEKDTKLSKQLQREYLEQAFVNENASLFFPTELTFNSRKRRREETDDVEVANTYEFRKVRDNKYVVQQTEENHYFFTTRKNRHGQEEAYFNKLNCKIQLNRKREFKGKAPEEFLIIKHRQLSETEVEARDNKLLLLQPEQEVEEEEEENDNNDENNSGDE